MTDDPQRLLSARGDADPLERELLASVRDVGAPAGAKDKAWQAIAAQLAAGALAGSAASAAAPSTAAAAPSTAAAKASGLLLPSTLAGKAVLTIAAGSVAVGSYFAVQHALHAPASRSAQPRARPALIAPTEHVAKPVGTMDAQRSNNATIEDRPLLEGQEALDGQRGPRSGKRVGELRRSDGLAAESALLTEARAYLRAGDPAAARAALDRLASKFPHGVLVQEREVLAIELLSAQGDLAAARRRARAFVSAYPTSPHSAKLRGFSSAP